MLYGLSLDLLAGHGVPHARPVLALLALFAAEPVPTALLRAAAVVGLQDPRGVRITEEVLERTVTALRDIGLVHGTSLLTVDPLVREAVRAALAHEPEAAQAVHGVFVDLLELAVHAVDPEDPGHAPVVARARAAPHRGPRPAGGRDRGRRPG